MNKNQKLAFEAMENFWGVALSLFKKGDPVTAIAMLEDTKDKITEALPQAMMCAVFMRMKNQKKKPGKSRTTGKKK